MTAFFSKKPKSPSAADELAGRESDYERLAARRIKACTAIWAFELRRLDLIHEQISASETLPAGPTEDYENPLYEPAMAGMFQPETPYPADAYGEPGAPALDGTMPHYEPSEIPHQSPFIHRGPDTTGFNIAAAAAGAGPDALQSLMSNLDEIEAGLDQIEASNNYAYPVDAAEDEPVLEAYAEGEVDELSLDGVALHGDVSLAGMDDEVEQTIGGESSDSEFEFATTAQEGDDELPAGISYAVAEDEEPSGENLLAGFLNPQAANSNGSHSN